MVCAPFEYIPVHSFDDAVSALDQADEDGRILAGGQSLVPMLNLRLVRPSVLVDVNRIPTHPPEIDGEEVRISALTRHADLLNDPVVVTGAPLLADAARFVGSSRVRNRGTIGGSLAHADPSGEIGAVASCLGATVTVRGPDGDRNIAATDFFVTYLTTALEPTELITEVRLPRLGPSTGWSFQEVARRTSDFAVVALAVIVALDRERATVELTRMALAGVADRPLAIDRELLSPLVGQPPSTALTNHVAEGIAASLDPPDDVHASSRYRRRLIDVLARRGIVDAIEKARRS